MSKSLAYLSVERKTIIVAVMLRLMILQGVR